MDTSYWWYVVYIDGTQFSGRYYLPAGTKPVPMEVKVRMARKKMMQNRVPLDLHSFFKAYCAKKGVTMTSQVVAYITMLRDKESHTTETRVDQF